LECNNPVFFNKLLKLKYIHNFFSKIPNEKKLRCVLWAGKYGKLHPTRVSPKVSGLTYKSRARWEMLRGIYSAIYGEVNVSVSVCVEMKGNY